MSLWNRSAKLVCRLRRRPASGGCATPSPVAAAFCLAVLAAGSGFVAAEAQMRGHQVRDHQVPDQSSQEAASARLTAKPVAAFALDHEIAGTPSVGVPLELRLTLRPQSAVADIVVQISTDAGLQFTAPGSVLSADTATREAPAEWIVTVVPMQEGVSHVKVYAEGLLQGSRQGRSIMVPVRVGSETRNAPPQKSPRVLPSARSEAAQNEEAAHGEKDSGAERLMRLPAEERR